MLQGTGSNVGKSLLVAGLCRAYTRRGMAVRPFKPQNMSNNAAVTVQPDGSTGEIGRAQALQARACGVAPDAHMNPVLLKPQSDLGAQVVVQGRVEGNAKARDYLAMKPKLLPLVLDSFARMTDQADLVLVEGAGSPAEVNLRDGDIANMGFALPAEVPVVLVADIDRGGVIAALVGTHELMTPDERAVTKGYIVNKFRGDVSLFDDGLRIIGERTGLKDFGVVTHFAGAERLPAEDAATLDERPAATAKDADGTAPIRVVVPRLPRIANFDDVDPFAAEPGVTVDIVPAGRALPGDADVVLLPGSKSTVADLGALREHGWDVDILAHARRGGMVVGLCAGFQMLGRTVADPDGIEGPPGEVAGLGLLDVETVISREKALHPADGVELASGAPVAGYEMHMGRTDGPGLARPMLQLGDRHDGAVSPDGRIQGCYMHGLFGQDRFRHAFLDRLRSGHAGAVAFETSVEAALDELAAHLDSCADLDGLLAVARDRA